MEPRLLAIRNLSNSNSLKKSKTNLLPSSSLVFYRLRLQKRLKASRKGKKLIILKTRRNHFGGGTHLIIQIGFLLARIPFLQGQPLGTAAGSRDGFIGSGSWHKVNHS